jgi:outer membrane biosynthesis protein TonB
MATYEELELDTEIINLIEDKSSEPGFAEFITPEGLRAWMNAGGNLAKEINGIGPKSVKKVQAALDKLPGEETPTEPIEESPEPPAAPEAEEVAEAPPEVESVQPPEPTPEPPAAPEVEEPAVQYVTIQLPVGPVPTGGYDVQQAQSGKLSVSETGSRHLQMRLQPDEAMVFLRLREGIRIANERLRDGRPAWNTPDVQRIIAARVLEQLGE